MKRYDPQHAPDPAEWLALDEQERIVLIGRFHRKTGERAPSQRMHAVIHSVVENQLAEAVEPVRAALVRLMAEGLDRHQAIHAIGSVLAEHLFEALRGSGTESLGEAYHAALRELTAKTWRGD